MSTLPATRTRRAAAAQGWRQARADAAAPLLDAAVLTREDRMDRDRRTQVLDRVEQVVAGCVERDAQMSTAPRVVLAVRQQWFGQTLRAAFTRRGIEVLDVVPDGADAVGLAIAEQPDLVLFEPVLARMSGIEVLRDLQLFAPGTLGVATVAHQDGVQAMLQAGAACAWARTVAPDVIAADIAALIAVWRAERAGLQPAAAGQ